MFPRGASSIHLAGVSRSSVTNNRLHSFYPGMVVLDDCSETLVATNHLLRDEEPWTPFLGVTNGRDDDYGLLHVRGSRNSIIGNHVSVVVDPESLRPAGAPPVVVRLAAGEGNYLASNHVVATGADRRSGDSAYEAQVDALLSGADRADLAVTAVLVEDGSVRNTVLDSGRADEVVVDETVNAFRATPSVG